MGRPILLDCHLILKCHEPSPERCKVAPDARNVRIQIACVGFERCQILRYRIDIPRRTDVSELPQYKTHWHMLHGCQEGNCNGCGIHFPVTQPEGRPRGAAFEGWNRSSGQSATAVWRAQLEERDEETGGADRRARGPANLTRWRAPACVTTPDCPVSRTLPSSSEPPFPIALRFPSPRLSRQYHILTHRWHLQPRRSSLPCRPGLRLHTRCVRHHRHP